MPTQNTSADKTAQHLDHTTLKKEIVGRLSTFSRWFYYQFKCLPSHSPEGVLLPLRHTELSTVLSLGLDGKLKQNIPPTYSPFFFLIIKPREEMELLYTANTFVVHNPP